MGLLFSKNDYCGNRTHPLSGLHQQNSNTRSNGRSFAARASRDIVYLSEGLGADVDRLLHVLGDVLAQDPERAFGTGLARERFVAHGGAYRVVAGDAAEAAEVALDVNALRGARALGQAHVVVLDDDACAAADLDAGMNALGAGRDGEIHAVAGDPRAPDAVVTLRAGGSVADAEMDAAERARDRVVED